MSPLSDRPPDFAALREAQAATTGDATTARMPRIGRPTKASTRAALERRLAEQIGAVGITVSVFDPVCGQSILLGGEQLAKALAKLADENPNVRRILTTSLSGSTYLELVIAVATIVLPMMYHHDMIPRHIAENLTFLPAMQMQVAPNYPPAADTAPDADSDTAT
jgi:hypothetical protein